MKHTFKLTLLLFGVLPIYLAAQLPKLSEKSTISVLTCGTGTELYSSFGHSAFRVQDPDLGLDVVYNYGTFDFDQPNFYLNFAKGRMTYSLSRSSFARFLLAYESEKRWVKEQILNLDLAERQGLLEFFEENYRPENRNYAYDPLFNNCSTIIGDILDSELKSELIYKSDHLKEAFTFRDLIMQHLNWNSWAAFGINTAYGSVVDRKATVKEHLFLPIYTMYQLENTLKKDRPLVQRERSVLDYSDKKDNGYFALSPAFWFSLLFLFFAIITYLDFKHQTFSSWLDGTLLLLSGLVGIFLLLLWLATDHVSTVWNFNVLWAFPPNIAVGILFLRKKIPLWLKTYLKIALGLFGVVLVLWATGIQVFSPIILLLMGILAMRYLLLIFRRETDQ